MDFIQERKILGELITHLENYGLNVIRMNPDPMHEVHHNEVDISATDILSPQINVFYGTPFPEKTSDGTPIRTQHVIEKVGSDKFDRGYRIKASTLKVRLYNGYQEA